MLPLAAVDATLEDLVGLVKACQKHDIKGKSGSWKEFVKAHVKGGISDPKKQSREVLEAYVADLLAEEQLDGAAGGGSGGGGGQADGAPAAPARSAAAAATAREFVPRFIKWAQAIRKDAAKGRGVLPPLHPGETSVAGATANGTTQQQQQQQQQKEGEVKQQQEQQQQAAAEAQVLQSDPQQVSVWSLVRRTRAHPKYDSYYSNLPSYAAGWTRVKRSHLSAGVRPRLLALDCEMCSVEGDAAALLGVCVVDEFGEVVYRQLVRPEGRILDMRTALTGVTEADLVGVTVTPRDAQRAVRKLLEGDGSGGRPVVLVGHSLHHDLAALRLDHQPVIDTSLIFSFRDLPQCTPGLKDLAKVLLGLDMRRGEGGAHDSREDASVTMRLVMRELQMAAPAPPLEPPEIRVPPAELAKLLVHSLPPGAGEAELRAAFAAAGAPAFERVVAGPDCSKQATQLLLLFTNPAVANEAFKKLPGEQGQDAIGRYYKTLALGPGPGRSCKVRKMACHNGMMYGSTAAPQRPAKRARSAGGSAAAAGGGATPGGASSLAAPPAAAGAGAVVAVAAAANGSARKAKRQKRNDRSGGGGGGGGVDPVKAAGKRRPEDGADGGGGASTAAPAAAAAPAPAAATAPAMAAAMASADPTPQPKPKKRRRGGEEAPAAQAAAAAPGPDQEEGGGRGGKRSREGKERKRKRGREGDEGEEGGDGGGEDGGEVRKEGKKARKGGR